MSTFTHKINTSLFTRTSISIKNQTMKPNLKSQLLLSPTSLKQSVKKTRNVEKKILDMKNDKIKFMNLYVIVA